MWGVCAGGDAASERLVPSEGTGTALLVLKSLEMMLIFLLFLPAKPEAPPAPAQEKPSLSEEEIERKCKSIIDEFLHINDFKVSRMTSLRSRALSVTFSLQEQHHCKPPPGTEVAELVGQQQLHERV